MLGAFAAHLMFDLEILQFSTEARAGIGQWKGELIATFGLILTIVATLRYRPADVPAFIAAQLAGMIVAVLLCAWLFEENPEEIA
jgi:glycerol uptake facilitator-like aquaporin